MLLGLRASCTSEERSPAMSAEASVASRAHRRIDGMRGPARYRPPPSGALAEMLARDAEAEDPPFGGWAGEIATPVPEPEPPPPATPFRVPPPDWEAEAAEREADPREEEPR
jgi:hypothetical protein